MATLPGLSDSLVYSGKPRAVSARKHRTNIPPLNGREFNPGDTIQIAIPCGNPGEYLNTRQSYLKFKLTNKDATNALVLDYSASAVIRLLEVTYGSSVLEYIDQYNALHTMLLDAQGDTLQTQYAMSITEGTNTGSARTGASIAGTGSITVCVPLISGVLGSLQNKYVPIGDMVRNHLKLNLTLSSVAECQASTATCDWEVTDVEYVAEIVRLDSAVAQAISQANSGGYSIPMTTFSNHAATVGSGSKMINTLISSGARSLKTLYTIFRTQANATDGTKKYLSTRRNPFQNAGRWQYEVAGHLIPQMPVVTDAEGFAELQKAFHAYGILDHHGMLKSTGWAAAEGSYIIAQDLESQSHKSMVSESGVDVSTATIHLKAEFSAALTVALRIDTFTHQDAILFIDPTGMAQTIF